MKVLEIHLIEKPLEGPYLEFRWESDVRESLEASRNIVAVGDGIAVFGEQIRVHALESAAMEPGRVLGPDGEWVA